MKECPDHSKTILERFYRLKLMRFKKRSKKENTFLCVVHIMPLGVPPSKLPHFSQLSVLRALPIYTNSWPYVQVNCRLVFSTAFLQICDSPSERRKVIFDKIIVLVMRYSFWYDLKSECTCSLCKWVLADFFIYQQCLFFSSKVS